MQWYYVVKRVKVTLRLDKSEFVRCAVDQV